MADSQSEFIDISQLRIGLFIYLDVGWMGHPFPLSSFKVTCQEHIDTIRALGIARIRYSPEKSDPEPRVGEALTKTLSEADLALEEEKRQRRELLTQQRNTLQQCERQFTDSARSFGQVMQSVEQQPEKAKEHSSDLVKNLLGCLMGEQESYIRLLSEKSGEKTTLHSINVTIISLLLGKICNFDEGQMFDLGMAALLHDIGKIQLPARLRWRDEQFTQAEHNLYREHVGYGLSLGRKMQLSPDTLQAIGQHHEMVDGSGFPHRLKGDAMTTPARVVSLVNLYDNLCNPGNPAAAITPHEALSHMFAQMRGRFDAKILSLFIRMMGVYPPGSVIQLTDDRFAMVVSVNSSRPLRPSIVIHDPHVPKDEALIVHLEDTPEFNIRRSLKPLQLPKAAMDYLSPRQRICYFFERGTVPPVTSADDPTEAGDKQ